MTKTINVKGVTVTILNQSNEDYISLTDMIKAKDGDFFISDWLRNRNTLEFLSVWETMHNPNFNYGEYATIRNQSGLNSFKVSVKEWVQKTNSIGVKAKTGRYGGTYAHKDIAFEFGSWISPVFKLYLIKEFQRLKEEESRFKNIEWDYRRFLAKVNYRFQTDAVKENIIPKYHHISREEESNIYASEAELINYAVFGQSSKKWRQDNPKLVLQGKNLRDIANIPQLTVITSLESYNAILIKEGLPQRERFGKLKEVATTQLKSLSQFKYSYPIESPIYLKHIEETSTFNNVLGGILKVPKPNDKK